MARVPSAKRYAQAVFQIAESQGQLDRWVEELYHAAEVFSDSALMAYLGQPRVRLDEKVRIVRELLKEADPLLQNLVCLLASRLSLELLPSVAAQYQELLFRRRGRERAEVVSAVPLNRRQEAQIRARLERLLRKEVVLTTRVDPAVVGGLVVRVGDKVLDGSVRARLESMKQALAGTT
ncbi:MAG: F0F1 ATP synthase subunit delta [Chloroflexi bacterium]|nr:F0F1 ATP synthase subunit delta [Chloroflexota bacterium]